MNGILVLDKPKGLTSFECVEEIKKSLPGNIKAGHLGKMKPHSTGVLPILVGKANKLFKILIQEKRTYIVHITFAGKNKDLVSKVNKNSITNIFNAYDGGYLQNIPDWANNKEENERFVDIDNIEILNIDFPDIIFMIKASRKFCINQFIKDISKNLGQKGRLESFKRVQMGRFNLKNAIKLENLNSFIEIKNNLLSLNVSTSHLNSIKVNEQVERKVKNGGKIRLKAFSDYDGYVRILNRNSKILAVGEIVDGKFNYISVLGDVV
ncbi:MAG TPA: hypothetical protein VKN74_05295 [Candidatus Mcinerneyibacterium sp.]|nr:hypothetical protein [Candidatus Mcinerneyibacterium sp.]